MQDAPNASAARTPFQATTDCGAFHRRSPTGGAANGMPLNTRTPFAVVPEIWPPSTATVSGAANVINGTAMAASRTARRLRCIATSRLGHENAKNTKKTVVVSCFRDVVADPYQ